MPSFPPPGVTPEVLEDERQLFLMAVFHTMAFGIHCCIFGATIYYILKASVSKRVSRTLVAYVFALFALGVLQAGTTIQYNMQALVDGGGYPGGPFAYYEAFYSLPVSTICNTGYVIAALLADGALLYRVKVIWGTNWLVLVLPFLAYLAEIALSILALFFSASPGASIWSNSAVNILIPYWSLGIANNMFMTLLIVYRMLRMRFALVNVLGSGSLKVYVSVSAMLIESAAIYSITGIVFIILYAKNSQVQNPILAILDQVVCIAPELIVMRVVMGRAWSSQTTTMISKSNGGTDVPKIKSIFLPNISSSGHSRTAIAQQSDNGNDVDSISLSDLSKASPA